MNKMSSLDKAIKIMLLFSVHRTTMDANEISEELGVPKSTVYRLLKKLSEYKLIEQDHRSSGYRLGIRVFQLGNIVKYQRRIGEIAYPVLSELKDITGETVMIVIIEDKRCIVIREVEGRYTMRMTYGEGRSLPLHAGAASKMLLASLPAHEQDIIIQEGLDKITDKTITDAVLLKKELQKISKDGYAFSDEEMDVGARAIAAPIKNYSGDVIASIMVAGPIHRFNNETTQKYIPIVKKHADNLSEMLGYGLSNK